jgi:hypothetical protein
VICVALDRGAGNCGTFALACEFHRVIRAITLVWL